MGGSGGSWFNDPRSIVKEVREAERNVEDEQFQTDLSGYLSQLLSRFNDRDVPLVQHRLDGILQVLGGSIDDKIDQVFGGSVAKHTYVDGLSDIDCLLVLNNTGLDKQSPGATLAEIETALRQGLGGEAQVSAGKLAITVRYGDGMEIQLLPAVKSENGLKIPSSRDEARWSNIDPKSFQSALTKCNASCDGKLIPTIKLAKAIIGQLPESKQLSGYHIESLAIDAFKKYEGVKKPSAMLPYFFEHAKSRILSPMTDSTGQSVHVDEYMGVSNSSDRQNASHLLGRIAKRMTNAIASGSLAQWSDMFGEN